MVTTSTSSPRASEKPAPKLNPDQPVAEQILGNAQASREVIQDFVPLADSVEWELGQQYLKDRGNKAFISDASPVPFVVNNDGNLSRNAAEVFFASLLEAENGGDLREPPHPQPLSQGERGDGNPHPERLPQKERGDENPHPQALSPAAERGGLEPDIYVLELGI